VGAQHLEELDVLLLLDRAFVRSEQAVRAAEPGDDRDVGPVEVELDDRRLPLRRPAQVRTRVGRPLGPDSSMKTIGRPSRLASF
jgi:hypothetical protein